jgi:hypothetical protein
MRFETVEIEITSDAYTRVCNGSEYVVVTSPRIDRGEEQPTNSVQFIFTDTMPAPTTEGYALPAGERRFTDLELVDLYLRSADDSTVVVTVKRSVHE